MPSLQTLLFRFYFGCAIVGVIDIVGLSALRVVAEISGVWDGDRWGSLFWTNISLAAGALVLSIAFVWAMSWLGNRPGIQRANTEAAEDAPDTFGQG
jgi:hypothetical protein